MKKFRVKYLVLLITALILVGSLYFTGVQTKSEISAHPEEVVAKFKQIVANSNSACYGIRTVMQMNDDGRIMGSCCGPMILHTYHEQLEALEKYSYIDKIPTDPYDISVNQAKELINDFKTIKLSPEQHQIYEDAKKMSLEGGPCCCGDDFSEISCWRWKVYGGLAKYLIINYDFNAEQIAEVWDISDGCGGDHHVEEVHG